MSTSIPIWWCIVQQEPIAPSTMSAYRIIKAYKCELKDIDRLYQEHYDMLNSGNSHPWKTTMIFHREPEETPIKAVYAESLTGETKGVRVYENMKSVDPLDW